MDTPEEAIEEISRLIKEGFTSGKLNNPDGSNTSWELNTETWISK